jgi:autotransporter-associated beta strand protein
MNTNNTRRVSRARLVAAALAGTAAFALAGTSAHAQMIYEPFDYGTNAETGTAANFSNTTGATAFSGYTNPNNGLPWISADTNAGTDDKIFAGGSLPQITGLAANLGDRVGSDTHSTARSPRIGIAPAAFTSGTVYSSFSLQLTDMSALASGTSAYILSGFGTSTATQTGGIGTVGSRIMLRKDASDTDSTKYNIGIRPNSDTATIQWVGGNTTPTIFTGGATPDTVLVVSSYTFGPGAGDDVQNLWVNPDPSTFGAGTAPAAQASVSGNDISQVLSYQFRARGTNPPAGVRYDELRADTTWAQVTPLAGSAVNASGNWGDSGTWNAGGVPEGATKFAYFNGGGGAVSVEGNHTVGTLTFRSPNSYTVAAGGGTLTLDPGSGGTATINVQATNNGTTATAVAASHTIAAPLAISTNLAIHTGLSQTLNITGGITGTGNLVKDDPGILEIDGGLNVTGGVTASGTLILHGTNTFTGNLSFVGQGAAGATPNVLEIDGDAALGGTTNLVLSKPSAGLTLKFDADTTLSASRTITISTTGGGNGPSIDPNGHNVTINGNINQSGTANLLTSGSTGGTLFLRNTNGFGTLFINGASVVNVDAADRLGTGTTQLNTGLGTLQFANSFAWGARGLTMGGSGGTIDTNGVDETIDGVFAGAGAFKKIGAGNLTLTSAGTRTGSTTVGDGTLTVKTTLGIADVTVLAGPTTTSMVVDSSVAASNVIGDQAAVTLAATSGSGILNLPATMSDTVGGLVINGVAKTQNGTYGATGSGATFIDDTAFSGTGVLNLQLGRTLYWDLNGVTAGASTATPATPTGNWGSPGVITFNTDSTGAAGGMLTGTSIATDPVVFTAGSDGTGTYTVTVIGAQKAASVAIARGTVTLGGTGSIATPTIDVASGATATISASLAGGPSGSVTKTGLGTLTLSGANTHTGGTTVSTGALIVANADALGGSTAGGLSVADGASTQIQAGLTKAVTVGSVAATGTGQVDLADNSMVIRSSSVAAVQAELAKGYNAGHWNGPGGITSSTAAASTETSVGYASNASLNLTTFKGVDGLTASDVLVKYTYAGDANLDGKVDIGDLGLLAGAWQQSGKVWFDGDFTYNGTVDIGDLGLLAGNWQKGVASGQLLVSFDQAMAQFAAFDGVVVPEPTGLALLGLAGAGLLARRRRTAR